MKKIKLLIVLITLLSISSGCSSNKYDKAIELISQNRYDEAIQILETISDNKEGKIILDNEQKYKDAVKLYNDNELWQALELFKQIPNYRDTNQMIDTITEQIEKIYTKAKRLYNLNDFDLARTYLEKIGDYKNSKEILKDIINKEEKQYKEALDFIKERKFDEALVLLNKIPSYKDSYVINAYISAEQYYLRIKGNIYGKHEKNHMSKILNRIPDDYSGDLHEIIVSFKKEILEKPDDISNVIEKISELIDKNEYWEASTLVLDYKNEIKDYNEIYNYISALNYKEDSNLEMMIFYLSEIDPEYDGLFSEDINSLALEYMTLEEWKKENKENLRIKQQIENERKQEPKQEPRIGMTAKEVENSTWGKPKKINKTITEYGTHEQWVYSLDRYIYLDDGIVTAIQESE